MIQCPSCGHRNIEGVDFCEQCQADLSAVNPAEPERDSLDRRFLSDSIMALRPQMRVCVTPEDPVADVVRTMIEQQASAVMVVFRGRLVGVFTERDLLMRIGDRYAELADKPIREFMTSEPEVLGPEDTVASGLNVMAVKGYRHIPIVEDGRPIALVRTRDVLSYIAELHPSVA